MKRSIVTHSRAIDRIHPGNPGLLLLLPIPKAGYGTATSLVCCRCGDLHSGRVPSLESSQCRTAHSRGSIDIPRRSRDFLEPRICEQIAPGAISTCRGGGAGPERENRNEKPSNARDPSSRSNNAGRENRKAGQDLPAHENQAAEEHPLKGQWRNSPQSSNASEAPLGI